MKFKTDFSYFNEFYLNKNCDGGYKEIYVLMNKKKLVSIEKIFNFCENNKLEDVVNICLEIFVIIDKANFQVSPSLFNFSASYTLSGGGFPCGATNCRLKKIQELAIFTSLYSDHTTIHNPFDFVYSFFNPSKSTTTEKDFRKKAVNALIITLKLKPLIERGLIFFSKTISRLCPDCREKRDKIIKSIANNLNIISKKEIFPLIKDGIEIEYPKKNFFMLRGIKSFIGDEEDIGFSYKKLPYFLIKDGKRISSIRDLNYDKSPLKGIFRSAIDSLMVQKFINNDLTQTYLTSNPIEKSLLEAVGKKAESKLLNFFVKGLPLIDELPFEKILETRERYSDEFKSFQYNVSKLVNEAEGFETQEEFNSYVSKSLKAKLLDLKKIQKQEKKKLILKGIRTGTFLGANVIISSISNYDLNGILSLFYAFVNCKDIVIEADELLKKIKENPIFFYYQLEKLKS